MAQRVSRQHRHIHNYLYDLNITTVMEAQAIPATKTSTKHDDKTCMHEFHDNLCFDAAIIRRLATKDCKTPRNYALNDDTGTPSSQNYKANSNQSV